MLKTVKVECIGNPRQGIKEAWVKHVTGISHYGMREEFCRGQKDYSQANSVGSRGVYKHYFLEDGRIYHVSSPTSWKSVDEYYCRVEVGKIIRMSMDEVIAWLEKGDSAKTSSMPPGSESDWF